MKRWILAAAVAVALPLAAASPEACSVEADLHPFMGVLELAPGNIAPPAGMTGLARTRRGDGDSPRHAARPPAHSHG